MFLVFSAAAAAAKSLQSRPTLWDPRDSNPPGSPIPGILQARTLEWVAISFSDARKWKGILWMVFKCVSSYLKLFELTLISKSLWGLLMIYIHSNHVRLGFAAWIFHIISLFLFPLNTIHNVECLIEDCTVPKCVPVILRIQKCMII